MSDDVKWYSQLAVSYGYKLHSDEEKDAFYQEVRNRTGAKNALMCDAIKHAASLSVRAADQYGRVTTEDVIKWIKSFKYSKVVKSEVNHIEDFIRRTVRQIMDGWNEEGVLEEVFYMADNPDHQQRIKNEILARVENKDAKQPMGKLV